ncbi:cysteine--tRNA ligase-like protein, mitochondrial [Arctopsyche grandis]|uniref:cysteine--tRNA ligase-like protein, mitochondrial n=1 Tax=Arctopsyche grandis TaxID=121162 RepID=UPI00406D6334
MRIPISVLRQTSRNCGYLGNKHDLLSKTDKNIQSSKFSSDDTPSNDSKWHQPSGTDTGIKMYNCVAKKKVPVILKNNFATWYSCGPTVYDSAHIGHASCYVKLDIIQKILINYFNIDLVTCMGVTDIDDKIIKKSITTGKSINEITKTYEAEFWKNISDLDITMPDIVTRVTDHIPSIVDFINEIMKKQLGYKTSDKSIYFNTIDYANYGKLQNPQEDDSLNTSKEKKSMNDFVLWKAHKVGEPFWETELGKGRPGWHIECSAMASRLFGGTVDFHAGGVDLKFPHHENEEAQSCAFHGNDQWINYWIHTGHLHLKNDVKMSKSLKNTMSIDDLLKNYDADTFRMACLMSHYRNYMEFHEETMHIAKKTVMKVKHFLADCNLYVNDVSYRVSNHEDLLNKLNETKLCIDEALKDDFNTSKCITSIIQLMMETNFVMVSKNSENFKPAAVSSIAKYIMNIMSNFGLYLNRQAANSEHDVEGIVDAAVKFRQSVRLRAIETKDKNLLTECDNFRSALSAHNIKINDVSKDQKSSWLFNK